jgi:hypothetical protein
VPGYTLAQIRAFLAAIDRRERADAARDAITARYAEHADGKTFEGFVDRLRPDG